MPVRSKWLPQVREPDPEVVRWIAERGVSIQGSTAVRVRGRSSGQLRGVVVNLLEFDGRRYLVSPRGDTQWARNARVAGEVEMGPKNRPHARRIVEVADDAKPDLLKPSVRAARVLGGWPTRRRWCRPRPAGSALAT